MKNSNFVIYLLLSFALTLSVIEVVLTSILLSRSQRHRFEEIIDAIYNVEKYLSLAKSPFTLELSIVKQLLNTAKSFLENDQNVSKISIAYLLVFNSLDFVFLFSVFISEATKLKIRKCVEISIIGTVIILKISVYTMLLVYRYIASKGLELSSSIIGYINSAVLIGTFCYKIISN